MLNGPLAELNVDSNKTTPNLYPQHLQSKIDKINDWIYHDINNGVYKSGFARTQDAYVEAVTTLFNAIDRVESILSTSRYITSSVDITEADLRLFMTLIRFDEVYIVYFKCNLRSLSSYPNITNYMRELYQLKWIQDSIHMDHIKNHYFTSHSTLNCYSVVPIGPGVIDNMLLPHDRNRDDLNL